MEGREERLKNMLIMINKGKNWMKDYQRLQKEHFHG